MNLNRVVAVAAVVVSLALAVVPVLGDFDWTSTAGVLAGIVGVLTVTAKWLSGWQAFEAREAAAVLPPPSIPDEVQSTVNATVAE